MRSKILYIILLLIIFSSHTACAARSITITVLDADTNEPIEGAVALAYWNKTEGIGLTSTSTVAAVEQTSDENGRLVIPAVSVPMGSHPPEMKVYKQGYVGWNSKYIYLGSYEDNPFSTKTKNRTDFKWKGQKIHLEKFKEEYSYISHGNFLNFPSPAIDNKTMIDFKNLYQKAINWEIPFRARERKEHRKKEQEK